MAMKLGKLMNYGEVNAPIKHMSFWPPGYIRSRDKLKTEYFNLQKTNCHQILQGADIWWGKAHNKVAKIWSRDHKRPRIKLDT